ncbi:hypothetical protein [Segatella maculosa]|uniref:hypothetical protein n=1 Tax=Segatella maculosa TaxID=439703 RepID=UPI0028D577F1|nr:hypothetical protein [Segatella maculosa]
MKMKKHLFTSWLAVGVLALGFAACASEDNAEKGEPKKTDTIPLAMGKPLRGFIDSTVYKTSLASPAKQSRMTGIYGNISSGGTGIKFFFDKDEDYVDGTGTSYYGYLRVNMGTDATPNWIQFGSTGNYTESGVSQPYTQSIETDADGNVLSALFHSTNTGYHLTKDSYKVRYGYHFASAYNNNTQNYVNIAAEQYQQTPGKAMRLAQYGDYATATAEDNGLYYDFVLQHHNAYITFMPYAAAGASHDALTQCKLWKVRISSDQSMGGINFYVDDNGLKTDTWPTGGSKYIDLYCSNSSGLSSSSILNYNIATSQTAAKTNGAIMVLAPGTYTNVKVEYYVYDKVVGTITVFERKMSSLTLNPGKNLPIYTNLSVTDDFTNYFNNYHMWGAMDYYWNNLFPASHDWTPNGINQQTPYPTSGQTRYYNDVHGKEKGADDAPTGSVTAGSPTINMYSWYVLQGNPRWDPTPFTYDGHLFSGRMWFMKASLIGSAYGKSVAQMSATAQDGTDFSAMGDRSYYYTDASPWSDIAPAQRSNFFFILPLGYYDNQGRLMMSGVRGSSGSIGNPSGDASNNYWSSTAGYYTNNNDTYSKNHAFYMGIYFTYSNYRITGGRAYFIGDVDQGYRYYGYQKWPGEVNTYVP